MPRYARKLKFCRVRRNRESTPFFAREALALLGVFVATSALAAFFSRDARAQQTRPADTPAIVQPGAPGQPSRTLPPSTRATLPPQSRADVEFMQGMIMHHSQAVEMTALIPSHTNNPQLRSLGARISSSQSDEIKFMQRWLATRGDPISMPMPQMPIADSNIDKNTHNNADKNSAHSSPSVAPVHTMQMMPGMLSPEQMDALRHADGAAFDYLFLTGMIQHHNGALIMVKDLFQTAGAGQDAELFNFATDADNSQRAEIKIMQSMLESLSPELQKKSPESRTKSPESRTKSNEENR